MKEKKKRKGYLEKKVIFANIILEYSYEYINKAIFSQNILEKKLFLLKSEACHRILRLCYETKDFSKQTIKKECNRILDIQKSCDETVKYRTFLDVYHIAMLIYEGVFHIE